MQGNGTDPLFDHFPGHLASRLRRLACLRNRNGTSRALECRRRDAIVGAGTVGADRAQVGATPAPRLLAGTVRTDIGPIVSTRCPAGSC